MIGQDTIVILLKFFGMFAAFSITGGCLANLGTVYPIFNFLSSSLILSPCLFGYYWYFYSFSNDKINILTTYQSIAYYICLVGYSIFNFLTYWNPVYNSGNFIFACALFITFVYKYWNDPEYGYLKNNTAKFRLGVTLFLVAMMFVASYCLGSGRLTAMAQSFVFLLYHFWILPVDSFYATKGYDFAKDLAMPTIMGIYFSSFIVGSTILVRAAGGEDNKSGTSSLLIVILLMCSFGLTNAVGSSSISRFVFGHNYSALVFGIQLYVNFSLDMLFINSDLLYPDFWIVLLWTQGYFLFRNTGRVDDISEWVRIRYGSFSLYDGIHRMCTCRVDDVDIGRKTMNLSTQSERTKVFLLKTQGELIQILTPCVLIVMIFIDFCFVETGFGDGSITVGMSRGGRPYSMLVLTITFLFKYYGIVLSRHLLLSKEQMLAEKLSLLEVEHRETCCKIDIKANAMPLVSLDTNGNTIPEDQTTQNQTTQDRKMNDECESVVDSGHTSEYIYTERRLEVTRIYLTCLLLGDSGASGGSVGMGASRVRPYTVDIEKPDPLRVGDCHREEYLEEFHRYMSEYWYYFVHVAGMYFAYTILLTTQLKLDAEA